MADETNNNEAVELVDGHIETVDVSKHPDPSIPDTDLSLADLERRRSRPAQWVAYLAALLFSIVVPYWFGRALAVDHTQWVIAHMDMFTPLGVAFLAWIVTVGTVTGLGLAVVESRRWLWRIVFCVGLAAEQFIGGVSLLKWDFWYSTYVVYGDAARMANAANLGTIAAGFGVAAFAVLWVGLLVMIRKDSPLNVLTRSWASFILFFAIEAAALLVVMFGGPLAIVAA